eukprot:gene5773-7271_t
MGTTIDATDGVRQQIQTLACTQPLIPLITQVPTTQSDDNYEYYCSISVYALKMRPRKQEGAGAGAGAAGTGTGTQVDTQREPIPLYPGIQTKLHQEFPKDASVDILLQYKREAKANEDVPNHDWDNGWPMPLELTLKTPPKRKKTIAIGEFRSHLNRTSATKKEDDEEDDEDEGDQPVEEEYDEEQEEDGGDYLASYFENDDDTYEHADSGGGEDEEDF